MKKILFVLTIITILTGCNESKIKDQKYEELNQQLIEYGKLIYDRYIRNEQIIEPGNYYTSIGEMKENIGHDVSMFVNPETKEPCDPDKTKIEFIVEERINETENNYHFNPVLFCG